MTAQSKDQALEVGAPAQVDGEGFSTSGTVLGVTRNLDDRLDVQAEIGEFPREGAAAFEAFARTEDNRRSVIPATSVELTGSSATLADWESPTIPGWIDGDEIRNFPGTEIPAGSIDPNDIPDGEITEDLIADESIGIAELAQALLDFIKASGGGDGKVGFGNLSPALQTLWLKLEKYPDPSRIIAADPNPPLLLDTLVAGGDFEDSGLWAISGQGWAIFVGVATFSTGTPGTTGSIRQTLTIEAGARYRVSFSITAQTAGAVRVKLGGTPGFIRRFVDAWSEDIVAGAADSDIEIEGLTDDDGASLTIDNISVRKVVAQGGMAPRLSDPLAQRASMGSTKSFSFDLDDGVWELEHPSRWTFDDALGIATYAGPNGSVSRVRFIVPAHELREPVSPNVFPREIALAFELRIIEIANPFRHGSGFSNGSVNEFTNWPGGVSVHLPGDLQSVGLGNVNPTHNRSQWFDKIGKFCGVTFFSEPVRFLAGAVLPEVGPNLTQNPEFGEASVGGSSAGWSTSGNGWLLFDVQTGNELGYAHFSAGVGQNFFGYVRTDIALEAGATYRLKYEVTHRTKGRVRPDLGGTLGSLNQVVGVKQEDIVAGADGFLRFEGIIDRTGFGAPNGADIKIDNVTLQKLTFPNAQGDRYVVELWIAAEGVTISNPRLNLMGQREDPEYRARATEETPTADWAPTVAVES